MALYINTNLSALNALRHASQAGSTLSRALQRLSSGFRINSAKDDAAGLAIAEQFTTTIRGTQQGMRNANDGISLLQTSEGALSEVGTMLQRMRELAVQSANSTNSADDRLALQQEFGQLRSEIDRVVAHTTFNGIGVLNGTASSLTFQVGSGVGFTVAVDVGSDLSSTRLGKIDTTYSTGGGVVSGALSAGGLSINGQSAGASTAGALIGQAADSAWAIAAAINQVESASGAHATATTTLAGGAPTTLTAIAGSTFSINGAPVGAIAAGSDAADQGARIAAAVNLVSASSGVSATSSQTTGALTLTASDGRDIIIDLLGTAADAATATANRTTFLAQTGLPPASVGTQASGGGATSPQVIGSGNSGTFLTLPTGAAAAGTVSGLQFRINGGGLHDLPALTFTTSGITNAYILRDAIEAITLGYVGQFSGQLFITGGNTIEFAIGGTASDAAAADANRTALTTLTGLTAAQLGSQAWGSSYVAPTSAVTKGVLTLSSTTSDHFDIAGVDAAAAGLTTGTVVGTASYAAQTLSDAAITTMDRAAGALSVIDGAIDAVTARRADYGALQNRLEAVIRSEEMLVNNSADSRSRIRDADFAAETSVLTVAQILQQASTAILAQANFGQRAVLDLLR